EVVRQRGLGLGEEDVRELDAGQLAERVRVAGARAATFSPHVARVHPAKLLKGLAAAVEQLGVSIHEATPVSEIRPGEAHTAAGTVRARWVVRATEGYTARLPGLRRALVPMNSSMIITQPLPQARWEPIGWRGAEVISDAAHVYAYLQRTAAGRTLCDLVLGRQTRLTRLPWVGRTPRRWEPEPLRWAGIRGTYALYRLADRSERRWGRPSPLARLLDVASARV